MNQRLLKKYASLTVNVGVNVKKGQSVIVYASIDQGKFVKYIVEEAYKAGAEWVRVEWEYQPIEKLDNIYQSLDKLSEVPKWKEEKLIYSVKERPCVIYIESEDPDGLNGIDVDKAQKARINQNKVIKKYRDEMDNKYQWTIAAAPSVEWAKKVFPSDSAFPAVRKLWEAILNTVYVTKNNNPVLEWEKHNNEFKEKCNLLNDYKFDYIEYKSSNGTDFKVWLNPRAIWAGGGETTETGNYFNPNMPTEEIFTSPLSGRAEGRVVSTKPLSYQGQLIENFYIEFKDGKAVNWQAESGQESLGKIITSDEGAAMLGEVALVPYNSPICQSGILFYNTLFDENASCHLALGRGFTNLIEGYEGLSKDELKALGVNDSIIHVDFMIGALDLSIKGYTKDGKCTEIFRNGNWAL